MEPLHTDAFAQKKLCTEELLHTEVFTHKAFTKRSFCTNKSLHKGSFCTEKSLERRSFYTYRSLDTKESFTTECIHTHTEAFTQRKVFTCRSFYTQTHQTPLHAEVLASLHTEELLQTREASAHRSLYTEEIFHADPIIQREAFAHRSLYREELLKEPLPRRCKIAISPQFDLDKVPNCNLIFTPVSDMHFVQRATPSPTKFTFHQTFAHPTCTISAVKFRKQVFGCPCCLRKKIRRAWEVGALQGVSEVDHLEVNFCVTTPVEQLLCKKSCVKLLCKNISGRTPV